MNHVYVAGSINMDVVATAARYPKMGETVLGREILFFPGGKGSNQAVSAAKLGAPTTLIGCLGEDAFGRELSSFLSSQGIDLTNVRYSMETHTGTAVITVVESDNGRAMSRLMLKSASESFSRVIAARRAKIRAPDVAACGFFREVVQGGGARLDLDMGRVFPAGLASQNAATRRNRRRASARRCDLAQVPRDAGAQKDRRVGRGTRDNTYEVPERIANTLAGVRGRPF
jgi:hypothetical protein